MTPLTIPEIDQLQAALSKARAIADLLDSAESADSPLPMKTLGQAGRMIRDELDVALRIAGA